MAPRQLIFSLSGIVAMCLATLLVPIEASARLVLLTALGIGISLASLMPGYDRQATRVAGPAVLVLALVPSEGRWALVALAALVVVGFAAFNNQGMVRVIPALGLPIAAAALRSGSSVGPHLTLMWIAAVVATLAASTVAWPRETGRPLGQAADSDVDGVVYGGFRLVQAFGAVAVVVPVAALAAVSIDERLPMFLLAQPRLGELAGPAMRAHPGLTGGLDAGATVELSEEVVLRVKTDRPMYWRGTTYEHWDGRRWTSDVDTLLLEWEEGGVEMAALPNSTLVAADSAVVAADLPEPVTVVQQFTAERAGIDVVLGASEITTLWSSANSAYLGDDGSLRLPETLGAGASWTVMSAFVPATADDMRHADPAKLDRTSPLVARYGVENDVHPEVAHLAKEITATSPTSYDKVLALEAWMDSNIYYTRDIAQLAAGEDAVHHLLFKSRLGYCEQIGSALVVMLRSLGIPARLVVGYVPGDYDSATGEYLSRGVDAHAWAEVYFPGVGWTGFDPTAGVPPAPADAQPASGFGAPDVTTAVPLAVAIVVIALAAVVVSRVVKGRRRSGTNHADEVLIGLQRRFDRCGQTLGLDWSVSATLGEKGDGLVEAGVDPDTVRRARSELERLLFGDHGDGDPDSFELQIQCLEADLDRLEALVADRAAQRLKV